MSKGKKPIEYEWLWQKIEEKIWDTLSEWKVRLWEHSKSSPETLKRFKDGEKRMDRIEKQVSGVVKFRVFATLCSVLMIILGAVFVKLEAIDDDQETANIQIAEMHVMIKGLSKNDLVKKQ